jgi:YfiH family protein
MSRVDVEIPAIASRFPGLIMGQSGRSGGISSEPYTSLNLGLHTDDDPEAVSENRNRFFRTFGVEAGEVAGGYQVHGADIKLVGQPGQYDGHDAFVTITPGVILTVTVADCVPVLIYDPIQKAVAAIHAGWRGTVNGIVGKTLSFLSDAFGTDPSDCIAYVGTCISFSHFEVDENVADKFSPDFKRKSNFSGKYFVDLKGANYDQLLKGGIVKDRTEISPYCTVSENDRFFSHRKESGRTGRMLAIVGLRS